MMTFTEKHELEREFCNDNLIEEELDTTHELFKTKSEEDCMTVEQQKTTICLLHKEKEKLTSTITCLEEEVTWLNSKIEHMKKICIYVE